MFACDYCGETLEDLGLPFYAHVDESPTCGEMWQMGRTYLREDMGEG